MQLLARLARRARHLLTPAARERDMDDEMRAHLEFDIADRIARGAEPGEARRAALLAFGGVERFKEEGRDARGVRVLQDLARDTAYAVRVLRKLPGFTIVSVLTIAIGIAGTTFVLTAVNTLLFRPPPVQEPHQLYVVSEAWKNGNVSTSFGQCMYPYNHYVGLRDASGGVFSGLAGFRYGTSSLRVGDEAKPLSTIVVSANYFAVLGIRPALGRFFADTVERTDGAAPEAVISHAMWLRDFAGRADAIGQTLFMDSRPVAIVGVAPQGFTGTMTGLVGDIWVPSSVDARGSTPARTGDEFASFGPVTMFGRLKDGVSPRVASAALTAIAQQLPPEQGGPQVDRVRIDEMVGVPVMARGVVIGFTGVLFVTAALVLFIAAVNVAGMLFARGAYRRREIAVRLAMGAGRGRIVRQLVTESVLLCALGGAVGLMLERWLSTLVQSFQPPVGLTTELDLPLNVPVLALTFLATLAAGVLSGLTPALRSTRVDVIGSLRGVEERGARGLARSRIVIAQLATSLVLLVTAGLFGRALSRALGVDPGLDANGVASAELDVESHGYDRARGEAFYAELIRRLSARPDIASASLGLRTPLAWAHDGEGVYLPGEQPPSGKRVGVGRATIDPNYLGTVKIPVILGRNFTDQDTRLSAP
ncbi:MAG TPA: ABC transporter permease, partial [Gemmatimonadaceae bacterium]